MHDRTSLLVKNALRGVSQALFIHTRDEMPIDKGGTTRLFFRGTFHDWMLQVALEHRRCAGIGVGITTAPSRGQNLTANQPASIKTTIKSGLFVLPQKKKTEMQQCMAVTPKDPDLNCHLLLLLLFLEIFPPLFLLFLRFSRSLLFRLQINSTISHMSTMRIVLVNMSLLGTA